MGSNKANIRYCNYFCMSRLVIALNKIGVTNRLEGSVISNSSRTNFIELTSDLILDDCVWHKKCAEKLRTDILIK